MDQEVEDNFWLHRIKNHGGEDKWSSGFLSANRVHGGVNMPRICRILSHVQVKYA